MDSRQQVATDAAIRAAVADRYSAIGTTPSGEEAIPRGRKWAEHLGYPATELVSVPATALASFTGIGAPLFDAELTWGEYVLDLGCGAGLDSILMARRVGPEGRVYGVDLAPGMVTAARSAVAESGLRNVTILQAAAEALPLLDSSIDVVVVNGLFNLVPNKGAVLREIFRVIRPGGRLVGAEIVITDDRKPQPYDPESWFR